MKLKKFFLKFWPLGVIFLLVLIFFRQFFFKGLLPIPGDIITGLYFPWFDYFPGEPTKNPLISDIVSQMYIWKGFLFESFAYPREIKLTKLASLFGAIVFSFSAFTVVWGQWGTIVHAALYLPLVLLLIEKYLSKPKLLFLGLISLSLAFSVFAGHPQITFYLVLSSFAYAIFRTLTIGNKKPWKTI